MTNIATAKSEAIASGVTSIATAKSEAIASALSSATVLTNALDARIDTIEGVNIVQSMGIYENPAQFVVGEAFKANAALQVFINGLQIHALEAGDGYTVADGRIFTLVNLGYDIDANDHIVVYGDK